jgi:small-conductance mechanosensitive channel
MTPEKMAVAIRFIVLLFLGLPAVYILSKWTKRYATKRFSPQQGMVFGKLALYSGLTVILISLLNELGFKLTHLLGAAGIVGIAVGFAAQTSVSNIISGLFLIAEKPFEVGDVVTVGSTTGVVLSIDFLSVKLRTFDNKFIRIPNETLIKGELINVTRFPIRRMDIKVGIAYKEDIGRVRNLLLDIAHKNPLCLNEPEPLILFSGFGASSVDLLFLVWATREDWLDLNNMLMEEIKERFDRENIEFPFPHISLYSGSATKPIPISIVSREDKV